MSALRIPGPDGRTILVPIDDGAVGRVTGFGRTQQMGQYENPPKLGVTTPPSKLAQRAKNYLKESKK